METSLNAASMKDSQSFEVFGGVQEILPDSRLVSLLGPGSTADLAVSLTAADSFATVSCEDMFTGDADESFSISFDAVPLAENLTQSMNINISSPFLIVCVVLSAF